MIKRVVRDISLYFERYAVDAVLVGILVMLLYMCICLFMHMRKPTTLEYVKTHLVNMLPRYISAFLMGSYLYITGCIALFSRTEKFIDKVDFSLLGAGLSSQMNQAFFIENILMFVPFGVFLPICIMPARKLPYMILFGFFGSLTIEVTQYVAKWGRFEVVDLWTNTLGAVLGWLVGSIVIWCYKRRNKKSYSSDLESSQ